MQENGNLKKVWNYLKKNNKGFTKEYADFHQDMQDTNNLASVHNWLSENNKDFTVPVNQFFNDMGFPSPTQKKKEDTSPLSEGSSPEVPDLNSSEVGDPSIGADRLSNDNLDIDPTASEIGTPVEKTSNPLKSLGKSFWKAAAYDIPSSLAGTGSAAVGLGEQLLRIPEIDARIHEIVNSDANLEKRSKKELQDISRMLGKYQKGLDKGEFDEAKYNEMAKPLIERAQFLTNNGFDDLVQDDSATKLQKSLTTWAVNRQQEGAEFTEDVTTSLDQIEDPIDALNWMSSAIGQASAYIPASVASAGTISFGAEVGSIYTDAVQRIAQREGISPAEVIEQGLDDPASALAYGTAAGLLEKLGADQVVGAVFKKNLSKSLRNRALAGGLSEAPTEAAQTILEQKGVMSSIDKNEDINWKEVGEAAAQGLVGGVGLSTAGGAISNQLNKKPKADEKSVQRNPEKETKPDVVEQREDVSKPEQPVSEKPTGEDQAENLEPVQETKPTDSESGGEVESGAGITPPVTETPKSVTKKPKSVPAKFNYDPKSRKDAIAKMFGEGLRINTDNFKRMAGENWVKDQKALPLFYTTSKESGTPVDQARQLLDEQYPHLSQGIDEQEFAQELVDFMTEYPQGPGNYVDKVVDERDKQIEWEVQNQKSGAVTKVRQHSMFQELDEEDSKQLQEMSDDDVLSLYLEIEKDVEPIVDNFPDDIESAEDLLNDLDSYLKNTEGYFGPFYDSNLEPYAREIQQFAKARLRGEETSPESSEEISPQEEAPKQEEPEVNVPLDKKDGDKILYNVDGDKGLPTTDTYKRTDEFRRKHDVKSLNDLKEGTEIYDIFSGKEYSVKSTKGSVGKLVNEIGNEEKANLSDRRYLELPKNRKGTDLFGNPLPSDKKKEPKQTSAFSDEETKSKKGNTKQQEIDRVRKDVEAQGGNLKVNPNAKEEQGDKKPINEGIFKPKEEKGLFSDPSTYDELEKVAIESKKRSKKAVQDIESFNVYVSPFFKEKYGLDYNPEYESLYSKDKVDFIEEKRKEFKSTQKDSKPNFAVPEEPKEKIEKPSTYGHKNTIFTEDAAAKARELLKKKLGETRSGLDPEMVQAGITLAGYHIEAGARSFADYSNAMINDLGESVRPFLRSWYEGVRYYPEFNNEGMSTPDQIDQVLKDQENESTTDGNLEQDSGVRETEDSPSQEAVQDESGTAGPVSGEGVQVSEQERLQQQSDQGVSRNRDTVPREGSNLSLFGEDNGTANSRDQERERTSILGRPRILDGETGRERSTSIDPAKFTKEQRLKAQKEAESITPKPNDPVNIRESLPLLYPEQQDDVIKAERRFNETPGPVDGPMKYDPKKGIMFTNGTGTGKTFSGAGIIKRFVAQGKDKVLIVAPSEKVINTWNNELRTKLNVKSMILPNTSTKGEGVRITTYANFRANNAIKDEDFDLIVYDESHRLLEEKTGKESSTTFAHYQISNRDLWNATQRIQSVHPLWIKEKELNAKITNLQKLSGKGTNNVNLRYIAQQEEVETELEEIKDQQKKVSPELEQRAKESVVNTKVVFLSASPFKDHFNLKYVNGYLFDWGGETTYEQASNTMSRVDPESRFFLDNFGSAYEWKYHRLQKKSDANPEAIAMQEIEFSDKLMERGAMSGRKIVSDYDYSREFPVVSGFDSDKFNDAFRKIRSFGEDNPYKRLGQWAGKVFGDYNFATSLYESLRTSMATPRIEKHLELGRKVIVFHRRQEAKAQPPFELTLRMAEEEANRLFRERNNDDSQEQAKDIMAQVEGFRKEFSDLLEYEQELNYASVVDQLTKHFGRDMVSYVNGRVTKKEKSQSVDKFNDDNSPVKVIIVQEEAGKEGISLHDTTGNHQRILMAMSHPNSTTTALQVEGRPYRIGNMSNAIYEYPLLGLDTEIAYFGTNINRRLSTTENLAMGSQARDLIRSFSEGIAMNSSTDDPSINQGIGGKDLDRKSNDVKTPFEKARLIYSTNRKGRKNNLGKDFFATPEPLGQKAMDWLNLRESEEVLEPSAGSGSIAMWVPNTANITMIEPSYDLYAKLTARVISGNPKAIQDTFENHHLVNKYDGIAMNPPYGSNSADAWNHTEKGLHHLRVGGRLITIVPNGPSLNKRMDKWMEEDKESKNYALRGKLFLPSVTFSQAGTGVNTQVLIFDKIDPKDESTQNLSYRELDLRHIETIDELFDELETINFDDRYVSKEQEATEKRRAEEMANDRLVNRTNDEGNAYMEESKHEKTGQKQFVVKLRDKVDYETEFKPMKIKAKGIGGGLYYKPKGGFIFYEEGDATKFKNWVNNVETDSGRKPDFQYSTSRGDGRTATQIDKASKKAGTKYFLAVMNKLTKEFPGIKYSTNKRAFDNVFGMWTDGKSPMKPNAIRWNDTIYFNPDQIYQDTPIHEYGHIWLELAKNRNQPLYKRGIQLVKDSAYHKDILSNDHYSELSEEEQLGEALAMAIGEKGAMIMDRNSFLKWAEKLWADIRRFFGFVPSIDLFNVKLDEFITTTSKELLSGKHISELSSLRIPETATMNLNTFKTTNAAWKDAVDRVAIDELISNNPDAWHKARLGVNRQRYEDFMTGVQDYTRPVASVQNEIVNNFIESAKSNIRSRDISDSEKKRLLKNLDNNKVAIKNRILADKDVHAYLDLKAGKVQNQQERVRKLFFGRHAAGSGMGSVLDWLTESRTWLAKEKLDPESVAGKLKAEDLTLLDLGFYSYVKHAKNYNARVRDISYKRGDMELINDGSGMSNDQADQFMREIEKSGKKDVLEEQWQLMKEELVDKPLEIKLEEGMISEELYNKLKKGDFGKTYVPLAVAPKAFAKSRFTSGVLGKGIKGIKGTSKYSYEDRVNPFIQLMANFDKSMNDIETNKALQRLHKLAEENPEPTYWQIHKPKYVEKMIVNDANISTMKVELEDGVEIEKDFVALGNTRLEEIGITSEMAENSVRVYIDGKAQYIELKDDRLREVFKKTGGSTNTALMIFSRAIQNAFSYFRMAFTGANPDFALPNFVRDLQDSMVNLDAQEVKNAKRKVIRNIPFAMRSILAYERGEFDKPIAMWYADMKENGGEIAWLNFADAEKQYKSIEKEIMRYQEESKAKQLANLPMQPFRFTLNTVLLFNKTFEMGIRLSVYRSMVELGMSKEKAALAAKNVTVNFNKKGSWSPLLNSLYLFVNAGIQGVTTHITALAKSKRARRTVATMTASMLALNYYNDWFDDDDEMEGLLTEHDRQNNLILYNPFNPKFPIMIPISYNMRGWKSIADNSYDVATGKKEVGEAALNTVGTFFNSLLPISENKGVPTLAQPALELSFNKRLYSDMPIYPDKYDVTKKDSELYFSTARELSVALSKQLSQIDESNDDILEISPNSIDYVFDWSLGGMKAALNTIDVGSKLTMEGYGNGIDWNKVMIARRFLADMEDQQWRYTVNYYNIYNKGLRDRLSEDEKKQLKALGQDLKDRGFIDEKKMWYQRRRVYKVQRESYNNQSGILN